MAISELLTAFTQKMQVEGRTSLYNPLLQKPVTLEPIGPGSYPAGLGGYAYIGPPPDFGGSYGCYENAAGQKQYGIKASKMHSIYDGSPVSLQAELKPEEREALLSQMETASVEVKCEHCRSELMLSVTKELSKVHCPYCSSEMGKGAEKVKECYAAWNAHAAEQEEKNDPHKKGMQLFKEAQKLLHEGKREEADKVLKEAEELLNQTIEVKKMGTKEQANVSTAKAEDVSKDALNASDKDIAKEAAKMEAPKDALEAPEAKKAEPIDHAAAVKQATEEKPMEELQKAPVKAGAVDTKTELSAEKKAKVRAAVDRYVQRRKKAAQALAASKKVSRQDLKSAQALKRELRIMATFEPTKFAAISKNPKLKSLCDQITATLYAPAVRAQVRADLKELEVTDPAQAEKKKKELDFIAPEILMEKPEHEHKEAHLHKEAHAEVAHKEAHKDAEHKEAHAAAPVADKAAEAAHKDEHKDAEHKEAHAAKDEHKEGHQHKEAHAAPAEALQIEHLAALSSLKGEKIEMTLCQAETENPFWNMMVDDEPVGRIYLNDQKDANTIRAGFLSESYAENLGDAIQKVGLERMLTLANARLFAHKIDDAEITARLRDKAKAEAKAEFEGKVETLRQDFLHSMTVAMVAADKNFFQEEARNALKGGLFNSLVQAGLTEDSAIWAIEAGFENAPAYFEFVMSKAVEIMDMPKEARDSYEKSVLASGKIEVATEAPAEEDDLVRRLVKSSVTAMAMGGMVSGEDKEEIRKNLNLSPVRRN
jgi:DNA-directed RNA polymerase subunit RPC12/RpoP